MLVTEMLRQCRATLPTIPRPVSVWDYFTYHSITAPRWASNDTLQHFFSRHRELWKSGVLRWGNLVQANSTLFQPGTMDAPADVLYHVNGGEDYLRLRDLQHIAHRVFQLKGTEPTEPDLKYLADHLTDEYTRTFGAPIPAAISPEVRYEFSTIYIVRKHLPNRRLSKGWFPLLVNPVPPRVAMIVPSRYWPQALLDNWMESPL